MIRSSVMLRGHSYETVRGLMSHGHKMGLHEACMVAIRPFIETLTGFFTVQ